MEYDIIVLQKNIVSILEKSGFIYINEFRENIEIFSIEELNFISNFLKTGDHIFLINFLLQKQKEVNIFKGSFIIKENIKKIKYINQQEENEKLQDNLEINI